MKSTRTTVCGIVAGGTVLILTAADVFGWSLDDGLRQLLMGAAGGGLVGLGVFSASTKAAKAAQCETDRRIEQLTPPVQVDP